MDHTSWFSGMGLLMWFILLGIPLVLGVGVYLLLAQGRGSSETPLQVLQRRYANGEISETEYQRMKQALEK